MNIQRQYAKQVFQVGQEVLIKDTHQIGIITSAELSVYPNEWFYTVDVTDDQVYSSNSLMDSMEAFYFNSQMCGIDPLEP